MPMGPGGSYKPGNLFPTDCSIRSHAGERALSINGSQLGTWALWLFISAQSLCRTTTIQQKQQDRKATCTLEILLICFILLREDIEPIHLADFFLNHVCFPCSKMATKGALFLFWTSNNLSYYHPDFSHLAAIQTMQLSLFLSILFVSILLKIFIFSMLIALESSAFLDVLKQSPSTGEK